MTGKTVRPHRVARAAPEEVIPAMLTGRRGHA